MYKLIIFVVFISEAVNYGLAANYCDPKLCTDYRGVVSKHIACDNDGSFYSRCSADAKILSITNDLKAIILKRFNHYRNKIASGKMPDYEPASDMTQIQWDDELSYLAELNVKQCAMKHDSCHNTNRFKSSGQNLGYSWTTAWGGFNPMTAFPAQIKRWFAESNVCEQSVINKFRGSETGITWGHFTAMVNHKSDRVGCAASQYVAGTPNGMDATYILMACNFSYTNLLGEPVYVKGKPCTKCSTGCSKDYPALCSTNEVKKYLPDIFLQ